MAKNNARIVDTSLIRAAGVQPTKDELNHSLEGPVCKRKSTRECSSKIKPGIKQLLRNKDEAQAITRFKWKLPTKCDITGEELERFLYYKGQLAFFYLEPLDKFFFMPYALDGTIDFYGRYNTIHPLPMANGTSETKDFNSQSKYLSSIKLDCVYLPVVDTEKTPEKPDSTDSRPVVKDKCVLLHDCPKQLSEIVIPRQQKNDVLLDAMSEMIPYMMTNAVAGSGIRGVRVGSQDEQANVDIGNAMLKVSAMNQDLLTAIIGNVEFQELLNTGATKMADYMEAFQSLDNFRLSTYGIENGGVFEKSAHMLQDEQNMNSNIANGVYDADLNIRQRFCDIVNSIWPEAAISVEKVEQQDQSQNAALSEDNKQKGGDSNETN